MQIPWLGGRQSCFVEHLAVSAAAQGADPPKVPPTLAQTREIQDAFGEVGARKSPPECGLQGISGML
jgi:hypothetical protein